MKILTLARDLRRRKAREKHGLFVAEGIRTVEELLRSAVLVHSALIGPQLRDSPRGAQLAAALANREVPTEKVDAADFDSAAETDSPQGVLAIAASPSWTFAQIRLSEPSRFLVLDAVQDPGNAGTMIRTAAAFGISATISLPGTVDLWNAKVVRSAMGAHFHYPCLSCTWDELDTFRHEESVSLWAADASGEDVTSLERPPRLALVVGNEGGGLSSLSRQRAERLVALPMSAMVESLNVAVAAGILLYELRR
jgi:TrmH family RNA methyltransferase